MEDLLSAMLSGTGSGSDDEAAGGELADMMGGLLGGSSTGGAGDMGDLLQTMLGGSLQATSPQGAGGMEGLLGSLLGGGGSSTAASPLVAPIANALADKLG